MSIKVLHIIDSLLTGGAETIAVNTFNALNKQQDVEAYLCVTRMEGPLKENIEKRDNYIFLRKKYSIDIGALTRLYSFIKRNDIKIIHAHTTSFFIAVFIKLKFLKTKVVWHNHTGANINLSGWRLLFLKLCSNIFHTVINVNEELNSWSKNQLNASSTVVLNNFSELTNNSIITKLKGNSTENIVCVAGLRPEKDHLNLLAAFSKILDCFNDVSLHIIGKNYKNKYSFAIEEYIYKHQLSTNVFLYDNCTDIKYILSQASIGVLSSKSEGLPISLLEYGMLGLPVVVTEVGDCTKVVKNSVTGIVVEKENNEALFEGVLQLLEGKTKAKLMGQNLKVLVTENYSSSAYVDFLRTLYKSINECNNKK
ncbi:MAG: glycosyltransferase [Flavobacteriaceae bacterium]|nr:glycosyltransferase [Flavobacteriaceae bacterium]